MDFIKGNNRVQIQFYSLEINVREENPVRFIDAFVEQLVRCQLGFVMNQLKSKTRHALAKAISKK